MGGIADNDGCIGEVVRLAFYTDEREVGVLSERSDQTLGRDERSYAGEVGVEERWDGGGVLFEGDEVHRWEEERASE